MGWLLVLCIRFILNSRFLPMEWTNKKVIDLIDLYRDRPVLWDCRLKEYKDRNKRIDALMEIAVSFGVEKEEVERKIKNLVCHLSRELKKEREGTKCAAGNDNVYKSKWFCYDSMLFLKDRNRPRGKTDAYAQNKTSKDVEIAPDESRNVDQVQDPLEHVGSCSEEDAKIKKTPFESSCSQPTRSTRSTRSKKRSQSSSATGQALSIMKEIKRLDRNASRDQYTAFGEQVGMRIRDLPSSHAKKLVKHVIGTTLFEAEMGKYDSPSSFANAHSQSYYPLAHFSQIPFSSASITGSIPSSSSPARQAPSYSARMPATYRQSQRPAMSPVSSQEYDDSDSIDSILMEL